MRVVHCKKEPYDILIDRTTIWGNPFKIGVDGNREEVIKKYEFELRHDPILLALLKDLHPDLVLGCWCKPLACHGDVIVKLYNEMKGNSMAKRPVKKSPARRGTTSKAKESEASSPFLKAIKGKGSAWKTAKKQKADSFGTAEIKDGTYKTRWTAKYGAKDGKGYAVLEWIITEGKYKGEKGSRYYNLDDDESWKWLSINLQKLLDEDFADLDDNPEELKDLLDQVKDVKPVTKTALKYSDDKRFINAFINELVDDGEEEEDEESEESDEEEEEIDYATLGEEADEGNKNALKELKSLAKEADLDPNDYEDWASLAEALSEVEPEEDEDSDEEEEDESEEEEYEDDDSEEEDEIELAKGDTVTYKPPKSRKSYDCEVISCNKSKQTATLQEIDGEKKWTTVKWSAVELAEEE